MSPLSRRAATCVVALACLLTALTGCHAPAAAPTGASGTMPARTAASGVGSAGPFPAVGLKPPLTGLIDRSGVPDPKNAHASLITGVVINLDWAQAEPASGQIDFALLEQRINDATSFGARVGHPVGIRLRIVGGMKAPDWLKDSAGRVAVAHKQTADDVGADDFSGDLPKFWTDAYGAAYADLQRRLAARYDGDPRLTDVAIGRCVTLWAEPFTRQSDESFKGPMFAAGFTVAQDHKCHAEQITAHEAWKTTRSTLSFGPYQTLSPTQRTSPDVGFAITMMDECRRVLGSRCVLANNSLRSPLQAGDYPELYDAIVTRGIPITFQTAKKSRVGDLIQALDWAAGTAKACSVELPEGYGEEAFAPTAGLSAANQRLQANCGH